ncbi:unnamed protein product, partial [Gulo gulo]
MGALGSQKETRRKLLGVGALGAAVREEDPTWQGGHAALSCGSRWPLPPARPQRKQPLPWGQITQHPASTSPCLPSLF